MGYTRIRQKRNELLISSPLVNPRRSERRGFFSIHKGRRQKRRKSRAKKQNLHSKRFRFFRFWSIRDLNP